jgi:hypothetical protein
MGAGLPGAELSWIPTQVPESLGIEPVFGESRLDGKLRHGLTGRRDLNGQIGDAVDKSPSRLSRPCPARDKAHVPPAAGPNDR